VCSLSQNLFTNIRLLFCF